MLRALGAGVWFTSAGLPVYATGLRKGRMIVNLWHGVPLKKIALLDPNLERQPVFTLKRFFLIIIPVSLPRHGPWCR